MIRSVGLSLITEAQQSFKKGKMKKLITAIALIPVIVMSLFPPIQGLGVPLTDSKLWLWLVLVFGFLGLYTLTLKINIWIKLIAVYSFINTFFSTSPFFSQFAYMELIACIYLYVLLLQVEDWDIIYKVLWCILGVNIILFLMQYFHKDNLLNFGLKETTCSLSVGNAMQAKSVIIILIALLIQRFQGLKKYLYLIYLVLGFLAVIYWIDAKCWDKFCYARGSVWWETIKLWRLHKWFGFGMGSYKILFHVLAHGKFEYEGQWINCHNEYIQMLFETGVIGFGLLMGFTISLLRKCKGVLLLGAILLFYPLLFQFPIHQPSAIPLLILFVVYIERGIYG